MRSVRVFAIPATLGLVFAMAGSAQAQPQLRLQVDQTGDFVLFGNTLGYECHAGGTPPVAAPVVGTVDCTSGVSNEDDSAPDILWRSDSPGAGEAEASSGITSAEARSTAVLELPAGATVTYARLYWAGYVTGTTRTPRYASIARAAAWTW